MAVVAPTLSPARARSTRFDQVVMQGRSPVAAVVSGAGRQQKHRRGRGQAVVEFALVLPVFLLLTLGVVDLARVFTANIALTNGVSNAAIYAAQGAYLKWCTGSLLVTDVACPPGPPVPPAHGPNPDNIAYQIQREAERDDPGRHRPGDAPVHARGGAPQDCLNTTPGVYTKVKIVATYDMTLVTPLMSALIGTVHMTAATTAVTY